MQPPSPCQQEEWKSGGHWYWCGHRRPDNDIDMDDHSEVANLAAAASRAAFWLSLSFLSFSSMSLRASMHIFVNSASFCRVISRVLWWIWSKFWLSIKTVIRTLSWPIIASYLWLESLLKGFDLCLVASLNLAQLPLKVLHHLLLKLDGNVSLLIIKNGKTGRFWFSFPAQFLSHTPTRSVLAPPTPIRMEMYRIH